MKTRKRVMCSGLAFSDQKDMKMLHEYALEGWIFKEMKGLSYILYKEEPQDLIFSYTLQKVKKEDMEDFVRFFEEGGWHRIPSKDDTTHFFYAKPGTPPLHTSVETRAVEYQPIFKYSLLLFVVCALIAFLTRHLLFSWLGIIPIAAIALCGGCLTCAAGCWLRTNGKYFPDMNMTFRKGLVIMIVGISLLVSIYFWHFPKPIGVIIAMIGSGSTVYGLLWMLFQYRLFKDHKEITQKKKDEELL